MLSPVRSFLVLALSASALAAAAAGAETAAKPQAAPALSLSHALAQAAARNETNEIAAARLQRVQALEHQAYSLLKPNVDAIGSYETTSFSDAPFANRPIETFRGEVGVDLSLFNASAFPAVSAARKNVAAQVYDSRELRRSLAFSVARAFINVIAAERQREAALRRRTVAQRVVSDARARADAGLASENDATRAKLELSRAELSVTTAQQAVITTRLILADLMGIPADGALSDPGEIALPGRNAAELERIAKGRREDIAAARLRVEVERKLAQQSRLGAVPNLGVRGSYGDQSHSSAFQPDDPQWTVALTARWSIYDGGRREAEADGHDAAARENRALHASSVRTLTLDLRTALTALDTAESTVVQSEVGLSVAQTNAREVEARAAQGLATAFEVADANASAFEAEVELARRRLDLSASRFDLRRVVGLWPLADAETAPAQAQPAHARPVQTQPVKAEQ
ncbi:MAG: TolC family protein [Planctomycetes bacterium]|nr:TolC family protein [Planctomycetota bacterium]